MERSGVLTHQLIRALSAATDDVGRSLRLRSLVVSIGSDTHRHDFTPRVGPNDIHSISKVVTCMVIGELIDRRERIGGARLTLGTHVLELLQDLPDLSGLTIDSKWQDVKLGNLLNHTIGHKEGFLYRAQMAAVAPGEILQYTLSQPLHARPGRRFAYSNVGMFLASVILQTHTSRSLASWANELIFEPLGFESFDWLLYDKYTAGCSGLVIGADDLHKLGRLTIDNGVYEKRRVLSKSWTRALHRPSTRTPSMYDKRDPLPKHAYGFGYWLTGSTAYFCDGTDGQYLVISPRQKVLLSVTAEEPCMKAIANVLQVVL